MQIPASELILNPDGSVYHLNLLPEDLAETVILVGDPDRVPLVSQYFDSVEIRKQKREFITHTGFKNGKRITVLSTGIGTDNIDIVLNELNILANINLQTRQYHPQHKRLQLVRIGTSGSVSPEVDADTILVSSYGLGLDVLMHYYPYTPDVETIQKLADINLHIDFLKPYLFKAPGTLIQKFSGFAQGITATCSGFYAPQGRVVNSPSTQPNLIQRLSETRKITNFEMETAGIYGLATVLKHDAVSVNAIVTNRLSGKFSLDGNAVIQQAIEQTLSILCD